MPSEFANRQDFHQYKASGFSLESKTFGLDKGILGCGLFQVQYPKKFAAKEVEGPASIFVIGNICVFCDVIPVCFLLRR